jgi:tRNA wybutosine-synthesizing protein 4
MEKTTNESKKLKPKSNENRVQATNDDSIVSKRSASRNGYIADEFLRFFVSKLAKRSPLINRG